MAEYRKIHTRIWEDPWFFDLAPDEKLLFVYLFSNAATSVSGIYERHARYMAFEVGLPLERVMEILAKFERDGKVEYEDGIVWVKNMRKYQDSRSEKIQTAIKKDLDNIPDSPIKRRYMKHYGMLAEIEDREGEEDGTDRVSEDDEVHENRTPIAYTYPMDRVSPTETETETETKTETKTETEYTPAAGGRGADAPAPPPAPPAPVSENLAETARKPPERAQNPLPRAPSGAETSAKAPKARAKRGESAPNGRFTRARPELSAIISEFVDRSGIPPPANRRELRSWYSAAQEMLTEFGDSDAPKDPTPVLALMRRFFEAREQGEEWAQFTISSPRSLIKTMRALRAGQVRTQASPGGRKPSVYEQNMAALRQVLAEEE